MHKDPIESLFIGANQIKLPSCHSTNQVATDLLADRNLPEGTVVITDHQTAGKGQRGNHWESEPGKNLTFSVVLKPGFLPVNRQFELIVISSLAITTTLEEIGLPGVQIKWPNDIYCHDSKIAGVLIENNVRAGRLEYSIIGIGLNVNQHHFEVKDATSIYKELRKEFPLTGVLQKLLHRIQELYIILKSGNHSSLRTRYNHKLRWLGVKKTFHDLIANEVVEGRIRKVSDEGQLIITIDNKDVTYNFKQVSYLQ